MPKRKYTYDQALFSVLVYEYNEDEESIKRSEKYIKRKLKYYELGPYKPARVNLMRRFKTELHDEIHNFKKSKHFLGVKGKYVSFDDFDRKKMIEYYYSKYPRLGKKNIKGYIFFAIFIYYMR